MGLLALLLWPARGLFAFTACALALYLLVVSVSLNKLAFLPPAPSSNHPMPLLTHPKTRHTWSVPLKPVQTGPAAARHAQQRALVQHSPPQTLLSCRLNSHQKGSSLVCVASSAASSAETESVCSFIAA